MRRGGYAAAMALVAVGAACPASAQEADAAYARVVARGRPTWVRAGVEEALALSGGAVWYWLTPEKQLADWDYPSWRQRFTLEAWRFDNNTFATNFVWHAFAGTGFHLIARANDFGLLASVGWGFATAFAWEFLLEFREKVSVNDLVVSVGSGVAVGEFAHWLGRYLTSSPSPRHPLQTGARFTLGLWYGLHAEMDGRPVPASDTETDPLGFSDDIWHRFTLGAGVVRVTRPLAQVHVEGELVAIPGYLAPGRIRRFFADGNVTRLRVRSTLGDGAEGHDIFADTTALGWHVQDVSPEGSGHAATIGASLAYHYRREDLGDWNDRLGIVHLPGAGLDGHLLFGPGWRLSLSARFHPDFAGIDSAAHAAWKADHPDAVEKTILRKQGYYYAWGVSGRLSAELVLPRVALGAEVFAGRYDSQEGLDRSQRRLTADVDARDVAEDVAVWTRLRPSPWPLYVETRFSRQRRESRLGDERARQAIDRWGLEIGATF